MARLGVRAALYLADRTLVAMTCRGCRRFLPGSEYGRRWCKNGSYIDRRCRACRWRVMAASVGR